MKLREVIVNIPDEDFLEINERSKSGVKNLVSYTPKKYIKREALDYEVSPVRITRHTPEYTLHKFMLKES